MTYHIFIGYDDREHEPYLVAKHTLEKHATVPIKVHKLHHKELRQAGLFTRSWTIDESGQYICNVDGKPFSTQFSHSRFLVPELWRNIPDDDKSPLTMFVDCDFLWTQDIGEMFKEIETKRLRNNKSSPVYCVQHDFNPTNEKKMDDIIQSKYNMKLWSAMMVFDMDNPDNAHLLPETVNTETGRWLHNFGWVTDSHRIGNIDEKWHYVPNHSEKNTTDIASIHYTEGGPWFPGYRNCRYGSIWWDELNDYLKSKLRSVSFDVAGLIDGK
jgi:hypothetical protein